MTCRDVWNDGNMLHVTWSKLGERMNVECFGSISLVGKSRKSCIYVGIGTYRKFSVQFDFEVEYLHLYLHPMMDLS